MAVKLLVISKYICEWKIKKTYHKAEEIKIFSLKLNFIFLTTNDVLTKKCRSMKIINGSLY